jgi:hypothetical protein
METLPTKVEPPLFILGSTSADLKKAFRLAEC